MHTQKSFEIFQPSIESHSATRVFDELVSGLNHAFHELKHPVQVRRSGLDSSKRNICFGANMFSEQSFENLPEDTILYNFEQLSDPYLDCKPAYRDALARFQVWDYSQENIDYLLSNSPNYEPRHLPIGYAPPLTRIEKPAVQDIDVLFYGSINYRRQTILESIGREGFRGAILRNSFGEQRDAVIARSKLVLNIHYYETQVFETPRVTYLLANSKAVVAEQGERTVVPAPLDRAVQLAPSYELSALCRELLDDDAKRVAVEEAGLDAMREISQADYLREVLQ